VETVEVPFDDIMPKVKDGTFAAGVIIHEGQLTYGKEGFHKIVDFGEWWFETTNLPLPLGSNAIRRDLGDELMMKIARVLKRSIEYSLANREAALDYALQYGRGLSREQADTFVGMYVNDMTVQATDEIKRAVRLMLAMGYDNGTIPHKSDPMFVEV
jgi:1,4-dihydroxy-6-naphthoate synthase